MIPFCFETGVVRPVGQAPEGSTEKLIPEEQGMTIEAIETQEAPRAIGPYSQAVRAAGLLFLSGQIPLDPVTMELVEGGIEDQARQVLRNLQVVLEAAGSSLEKVVRTTVYLVDLGDFPTVNAIYAEYFPITKPARSTIEVARLPREVRIEIDAIALA
jgi:2-iminobutanoate/2-iminopropanoate deaminase